MTKDLHPRSDRLRLENLAIVLSLTILLLFGAVQAAGPQGELRLGEMRTTERGALRTTVELDGLPLGLTGLQFDLVTSDPQLRIEGSLGAALKKREKFLVLREVDPGVFRVLIIGFNQNEVSTGPLADIILTGSKDLRSASRSISVQRVIGTDAAGQRVEIGVVAAPERDRRRESLETRSPHGGSRRPRH